MKSGVIGVERDVAALKMRVEDGAVRIVRRGQPKLVTRVAERCFDAARALRAGKRILYVTSVGVFEATASGLALVRVMPGIDAARDVLAMSPFPIALPASGVVPVVDRAVLAPPGAASP